MARHIMLLFLSDVKVNADGVIESTLYDGVGPAQTTNESAVRFLLQEEYKGESVHLDKMFVFASQLVRNNKIFDRNKKVEYQDAEGHTWTHLEYFKMRMRDMIPAVEDVIDVYSFDEYAPITSAMGMAIDMAERIQAYVRNVPTEEEVILHADCTGGLRHANMMMLDVMRLMQYNRVQIGHVLYSNYNQHMVEVADDIYQFFDLIAGAEEFVRFGSVSGMEKYFVSQAMTPAMVQLLEAMRNFSEEIKLCHRGNFQQAIGNLRIALQKFSTESCAESSIGYRLMRQLQVRIESEYGPLLAEDMDELVPIDWCLSHGYLQQAMTLYTECVPEYLVQAHILYQSEAAHQALSVEVEKDPLQRDENFYLLNVYEPRISDSSYSVQCFFANEMKKIFEGMEGMDVRHHGAGFDVADALERMEQTLRDRQIVLQEEAVWRRRMLALGSVMKNCVMLKDMNALPMEELADIEPILSARREYLCQLKYGGERAQALVAYLHNQASIEELVQWFSDVHLVDKMAEKYPRAVKIHALFAAGMLESRMAEERILAAMERYFIVKQERNDSNHARREVHGVLEKVLFKPHQGISHAEQLRIYMCHGIKELRSLIV